SLDLLGDLLSALRHWNFFPFIRAGFVRRSLKERRCNTPFARKWNRCPFQRGERNIICRAIGLDLFLDFLLFCFKHGVGIISARAAYFRSRTPPRTAAKAGMY